MSASPLLIARNGLQDLGLLELSGVLLHIDSAKDDLAWSHYLSAAHLSTCQMDGGWRQLTAGIAEMIEHDTELLLLDLALLLHLVDDVAVVEAIPVPKARTHDASHHADAVIVDAEFGLAEFDICPGGPQGMASVSGFSCSSRE